MKKLLIFLVSMLIAVSLCACSSTSTTYTINKNGTSYVVDTVNNTISNGTHSYQYSFSGNSSSYIVSIIYPDGSTYWWRQESGRYSSNGSGGWSDDYDANRYVDGDTLCDVLLEKAPKESSSGNFFIVIFLLAVGIFNIASPYNSWYLQYGWRYKNAEPSDSALTINRIAGGVAIIVAAIMIFL